ncbi:MAG: hypothetical protein ABW168_05175 [Sedimenticola sp.]
MTAKISWFDLKDLPPTRLYRGLPHYAATAPVLVTLMTASTAANAAEPTGGGFDPTTLAIILAVIGLTALIIFGLTHWSQKQEQLSGMVLFCMKHLAYSEDEEERCDSAKAIGRFEDSGALLVLVDIILDEEETPAVRKVAAEALHTMGARFNKYKQLVADFEQEVEQKNIPGIIGILDAHFEQREKKHTQSAYVIGRLHVLLGLFEDAREWLTKAEIRNEKYNLYGSRIKYWISECNIYLLEEADDAFRVADYLEAKRHYAILDHGLDNPGRRRSAFYLRSACVYCKLQDYQNAHEALMQALEHRQQTDLALKMAPMLREILELGDAEAMSDKALEDTKGNLGKLSSTIMEGLMALDIENTREGERRNGDRRKRIGKAIDRKRTRKWGGSVFSTASKKRKSA